MLKTLDPGVCYSGIFCLILTINFKTINYESRNIKRSKEF